MLKFYCNVFKPIVYRCYLYVNNVVRCRNIIILLSLQYHDKPYMCNVHEYTVDSA